MAIPQVSEPFEPSPAQQRLLDAAITCLGRYGYAKTTLDDIARVAGCGRATAYRYFPSRSDLIARAVESRIFSELSAVAERAAAAPDLEAALVTTLLDLDAALDAPALRFVFGNEPQLVLPEITFAAGDSLLATAALLLAPGFFPHLATPAAAHRCAAWLARIALVYMWAPDTQTPMDDPVAVTAFVRDLILPSFQEF